MTRKLSQAQITLLSHAQSTAGTPAYRHLDRTISWALNEGFIEPATTVLRGKWYKTTRGGTARLATATLSPEAKQATKLAIRTAAIKARKRLESLVGGLPAGPVRDEIEAIAYLLDVA